MFSSVWTTGTSRILGVHFIATNRYKKFRKVLVHKTTMLQICLIQGSFRFRPLWRDNKILLNSKQSVQNKFGVWALWFLIYVQGLWIEDQDPDLSTTNVNYLPPHTTITLIHVCYSHFASKLATEFILHVKIHLFTDISIEVNEINA